MTVSVPELVKARLSMAPREGVFTGGVVVGPVSADQVNDGVVAVIPTGMPVNERYLPLTRMALGLRCVASSVAHAERISSWVRDMIHELRRTIVLQPSDGNKYLVHYMTLTGGPNLIPGPVDDSWEVGWVVETLVGTEPVS